jgi:NAD(P)-dependent dehydrogenase (short-subunit alcohol dehydrogenase family)
VFLFLVFCQRDCELDKSTVLDQFRLTGRTALITGGSQGLGLVIGHALAHAGAQVVIVSRRLDACRQAASSIEQTTGQKAFYFSADVTSGSSVRQLYEAVTRDVGAIDILHNCAGVNKRGDIQNLSEEDWDFVLDANLKGPFLMSRAFGPAMATRGWGRIVQFGSILSTIGIAGRTPYASSKAGVVGLTKVLALEWAQSGVTVNAICPGPFATEMNRPLLDDPDKYRAFVSKIPMGRWGELPEICGAALFLSSPACSYVTGSTLTVDGGWTAQ